MKIDFSWKENVKIFICLALFFAITGGIRWYNTLDNTEAIESPERKSTQTGDYIFTDEDFELTSSTSNNNIFEGQL